MPSPAELYIFGETAPGILRGPSRDGALGRGAPNHKAGQAQEQSIIKWK